MRARWLKPDFFTDKKVAAGGAIAALVYQALWCMADDGGTAPCDPDTVKAQLFYRWSAVGVPEITEALRHLAHTSRIVRYRVGDDTYATISSWETHQKVHKPGAFRYPIASKGVMLDVPEGCVPSEAPLPASPPSRHLDTKIARHLDTQTPRPPRKAAREGDERFDAIWLAYPKRTGGNSRADAYRVWLGQIKSGVDELVLLAGTQRYAVYCRAMGKEGTETVMQACRFYGPGKHWEQDWTIPATPPKSKTKPAQYTYEPTEGEDIQWAK